MGELNDKARFLLSTKRGQRISDLLRVSRTNINIGFLYSCRTAVRLVLDVVHEFHTFTRPSLHQQVRDQEAGVHRDVVESPRER